MKQGGTFDFVIVGAGSAGCVLAERLSANPRHKVLLIEAGGSDQRFKIKMPLGYGLTFADPKVNWRYQTEADAGLQGRAGYWPRGKVIGGSSSINAMAYVRGLPYDFDDWERAGATGWNWNSARSAFDAIERRSEQDEGGPVWVTDTRDRMHPFTTHFLNAGRELGWSQPDNMNVPPKGQNDRSGEGLTYMRSTVRDGRRWSAADAFLHPAKKRGNLTVIRNALVERVIVENGRARGVILSHRGTQQKVRAARETILSTGAIGSPQLLQLSGIGPADLLRPLGIQPVADLPEVGRGLQDHLCVSQYFWSTEPTLNQELGTRLGQVLAGLNYVLRRRGPLSVPVNQCGGFVRSEGARVADVQLYCNPVSYVTPPIGQPQIDRDSGFALCSQPCRPTSRGEIAIRSSNPLETPAILPNSLSTQEDRDGAVRASRILQALAQAPSIARVTQERRAPDIVGMGDAELLENFKARAGTVYHPTCTCRMGTNSRDSVVDNRLRVHGVGGLRVVDASAFPNITSGNTNAPTMMLAWRAAELILEDTAQKSLAAE